jgi:group I intron endonuclease
MNNYLIYKHTSPSGKSYIGQTNDYHRRCKEHQRSNKCPAIHNAIKYYGWDNFIHEILHDNLTIDQANVLEAKCILEYKTLSPNGYNLATGGLNSKLSQESRNKLSLSCKNMSKETRAKMALSGKNSTLSKERKANTFEKLKQQYLQVTLTKNNYSAGKLAKLLFCKDRTIIRHLNPTTRTSVRGKHIILVQQIHDYFNQPNPYLTLNT